LIYKISNYVINVPGDYGPWSASVDLHHFGIGKVNVINSTTMVFDYVQTSIDYVYDSIVITKTKGIV
jgi:hypothetical protein